MERYRESEREHQRHMIYMEKESLYKEKEILRLKESANLISKNEYDKVKKVLEEKENYILKKDHDLRMEDNIFIPEEIDGEIKLWESIKSCNYSQRSVMFNTNIDVDNILKQLSKAKQDKKAVKLEIRPLHVYYQSEEEKRKLEEERKKFEEQRERNKSSWKNNNI